MIFDNIRFYCTDFQTGLMEPRFICRTCGKEFAGEPLWQLRIPLPGKKDGVYELRFWCSQECRDKENKV